MSDRDPENDEETSSSYEEESSSEEEEPRLKYQRLGASVPAILRRDRATALTVHPRFLCLGTDRGIVYLLDFEGNQVKRFEAHDQMIRSISVDLKGEFMASASLGDKVVIHSFFSKDKLSYSFPHLIDCVSIDPGFASSKVFLLFISLSSEMLIMTETRIRVWWQGGKADTQ